jgi:hypothetical protein
MAFPLQCNHRWFEFERNRGRKFTCTEWEQKFPLGTVDALSMEISDHTPLLLNTGEEMRARQQPQFKFELGWR